MDNCYFEAEYGHIMHKAEVKVRDRKYLTMYTMFGACFVFAIRAMFVRRNL
jgi:hypothetical protein